jgi:hypothetical protein
MRALLVALPLSILTLFPVSGNANAGDRHQIAVSDSVKDQSANPKSEKYHGYFLDLSEIAEQQNYTQIVNSVKLQLDIVEGVGLSPRVLKFFHSVPVVVDEFKCLEGSAAAADDKKPVLSAACYNAKARPPRLQLVGDTDGGVVMVRTRALSPEKAILLHEMLHAYHAQILPEGTKNQSILFYYAKAKGLYPEEAYLMTNEREFFAVTASVFLSGKADGGVTRSDIKQKQPDYYNYLAWLFELDPDHTQSGTPVASAN